MSGDVIINTTVNKCLSNSFLAGHFGVGVQGVAGSEGETDQGCNMSCIFHFSPCGMLNLGFPSFDQLTHSC